MVKLVGTVSTAGMYDGCYMRQGLLWFLSREDKNGAWKKGTQPTYIRVEAIYCTYIQVCMDGHGNIIGAIKVFLCT